jgi:hypothetical protein
LLVSDRAGLLIVQWLYAPATVLSRLEEQCPESVCSFVILIKNEISDEGAKHEHTGKDIEKN